MVTFDSMKDSLDDLKLSEKDIKRIVEKYCECKSPEYLMQYDAKFIKRKQCKHPATRQCLTKHDKIVYECIDCGLLQNSPPPKKPLSQDPWI